MKSALTPDSVLNVAKETHPVVGVIGGMGPEATLALMQRVVRSTPATDDADHIHLIIDNNPKVPSRIAALVEGHGKNPAPVLATMAERLEIAGADVLAIPCNTAHTYLDEIRSAVAIPVMDMIGMTAKRISSMPFETGRVGIIASTAVLNTGLYDAAFKTCSLELVYPERQAAVMSLIGKVKTAAVSTKDLDCYQQIVRSLANAGANFVLVACTDLSVITDSSIDTNVPVIDALDVLVDEIISFAQEITEAAR